MTSPYQVIALASLVAAQGALWVHPEWVLARDGRPVFLAASYKKQEQYTGCATAWERDGDWLTLTDVESGHRYVVKIDGFALAHEIHCEEHVQLP